MTVPFETPLDVWIGRRPTIYPSHRPRRYAPKLRNTSNPHAKRRSAPEAIPPTRTARPWPRWAIRAPRTASTGYKILVTKDAGKT